MPYNIKFDKELNKWISGGIEREKFIKMATEELPGWSHIIEWAHNEMIAIDPDYEPIQIKEKFGALRFYFGSPGGKIEELEDIFEAALSESLKHCENCGTTENVDTRGSWLKTLCEECRKEKNKNRL